MNKIVRYMIFGPLLVLRYLVKTFMLIQLRLVYHQHIWVIYSLTFIKTELSSVEDKIRMIKEFLHLNDDCCDMKHLLMFLRVFIRGLIYASCVPAVVVYSHVLQILYLYGVTTYFVLGFRDPEFIITISRSNHLD